MSEDKTIPFFNDANVGPAVKRLAMCFNMATISSSEDLRKDWDNAAALIDKGLQYYKASTVETLPAAMNADEKSYLHAKFYESSARLINDNGGWGSPSADALDKAATLMAKAVEMKIVQ